MRYIFSDYLLDTQRYELHHAGEQVPLQPKVFQVLAYRLTHRDRVVLKQELLEHLWPNQFVGDAALNCYIMAVRQAIGDSGHTQRLIRTVRGRGYRFVAPVSTWDLAVPVEEQRPPLPATPGHMDSPGPPTVLPGADAASSRGVTWAADGEYKLVTVLCCTLADAPVLSARPGPEALYHVMQAFLALAHEVMQRYDGTLTHITGEGFTALFGAPVAQEDHEPTALTLPGTVQAVLTARIDCLPPEAKRLLQTAVVIGTAIPLPLLQAIAEMPEAALYDSLAPLQAAEFLYETRLFPEREYTFKHALTHEVAYGSLLQERRRALHGHIIAAVEGLYADRLTEQGDRLAHHALRGEVWDKALAYCRQAATKAFARSALREAVAYFEQALVALAHLPERRDALEQAIDLRCALFPALNPLEEYARVFDHLRVAETLAEWLGDTRRLGRTASSLCSYFTNMGEHDSAIAAGQRAFTLATTSGVSDVQVIGQTPLGAAYYTVGDFRQALDYARRPMVLFTGEPCSASFGQSTLPAVGSRRTAALSLAELGDFAAGRSMGEGALRIAEAAEQPFSIAMALMTVGAVYYRQGDVHTAVPVLERGLALCQTANFPRLVPLTASFLGAAYTLAGRIAEARPLLARMLARVATASSMLFHTLVLTGLCEALCFVSRMHGASARAERLLKRSHTHRGRGYQAHACRLLGDIAAHRHPQRSRKRKPITARPSSWPKPLVCVRSRPTATGVSASYTPRPTSGSKPVWNWQWLSTSTAPWR